MWLEQMLPVGWAFRANRPPVVAAWPTEASSPARLLRPWKSGTSPRRSTVNTLADTQVVNLTTGQDATGHVSRSGRPSRPPSATPGGNTIDLGVAGHVRPHPAPGQPGRDRRRATGNWSSSRPAT